MLKSCACVGLRTSGQLGAEGKREGESEDRLVDGWGEERED